MWGWQEEQDVQAYRGAERRGPDRMPPSLTLEDPSRQFWWRAAVVAPLVGAFALAAAAVTAEGFDEISTAHASLRLCWCIIVLLGGLGFCLRWRMTGEAALGLLGAALVVWSLPQLPFALADVAGDPDVAWRRLGPTTRLTVMVPAAWLMLRAVRSPAVDSGFRPVTDVLGYSLAATAAAGALTTGQALGLLAPMSPLARSVSDCMLAAVLLGFAWLFARRTRALAGPVGARVAVAFTGLGLASLGTVAARTWSRPLLVATEFVAVLAVVLLALVAASLLRSALDFYGLRMLSLTMRVDSAEDAVRRDQERMHELRSTVAGIRQASGTLSRYAHRLDPNREHDLQEMMAAELSRLERLLTADLGGRPLPGPVMLDELIRPLVICHREQGVTVHWRPTRTCALAHGDAVADVLNILLTNARIHAPGATVDISVTERDGAVRIALRDDGPGITSGIRDRLFERGARRAGSPGEGLGLHIARDLATDSGGALELLPAAERGGAGFVLTLPAVSDPTTARSAGHIPLKELG